MTLLGGTPGPEVAPLTDAPLADLMRIRRSPEEHSQALTRLIRRAIHGDR